MEMAEMVWFIACAVLVHQSTSQCYEGDRCVDSVTNSQGRCCPVQACTSAVDDLRAKKRLPTPCSFSGHTPIVCCRYGCNSVGQSNRLTDSKRKSEEMCTQYDEAEVSPLQATNRPRVRRDFSIQAVGGEDTKLDEFPHMAAVGWPLKIGGYAFNCGGSLISEKFVLTAGHCLSNPRDTSLTKSEPTIVRLGDQNILDSIVDGAAPLDVPIARRIKHPNYRPPVKYFDIALLELETVVPFSDHVRPICLWTNTQFSDYTRAIVTGWGTTVSGGRMNSEVLQKVNVDILETSVCQPLLQSSQNRNWQGFYDHQLCAGVLAGGKDACQGDSGGPLQIKALGYLKKYYVIGVTSFGRECGKRNLPGVYTRVSSFLDWIEPIVWP